MIALLAEESQTCNRTHLSPFVEGLVDECRQPVFHAPPCTPDVAVKRKHRRHVPAVTALHVPDRAPRHRAEVSA